MYLSRVEINPYRRESMRALDSPQILHAAIMASFDSFTPQSDDRSLWRIDKVGSATYILVQSGNKPDFHHIIDQFGRPDAEGCWDTIDYDGFLSKIECGQSWRFRLRANPVYSIPMEGKRGKICAHVTAEQQMEWLRTRSIRCGFSVEAEDGTLTADIIQREVRRFDREGKHITISMVTYEGMLRVLDADEMRKSIREGIGRAKAYGCGMITLARFL